MGEERYVKQIISDVMEMAAKIKFLEAKVAASESWSAECTDDHKRELAAALRRAKAEGRIKSMWEAVHIANTYNCDHNHGKKATEAVDNVLLKLYDCIAELEADARAAQIEEGEEKQS